VVISRVNRIVAFVLALASGVNARAVVYPADGSDPPFNDWFEFRQELSTDYLQDWQGEVLGSRVTPFEIRVASEEAGHDLLVRGSLRQEVIREQSTGYLSFHYRVGAGRVGNDTTDFEGITLTGFGSGFTDVRTNVRDNEAFALRRLDGGDTFYYWVDKFSHWIIVRTNAPDFAEGGSFHYAVDWDGWGEEGSATVTTFRPVPEPTTGIAALTGAAALLLRRRCGTVVPPPSADR
jgi:hypothetical protein